MTTRAALCLAASSLTLAAACSPLQTQSASSVTKAEDAHVVLFSDQPIAEQKPALLEKAGQWRNEATEIRSAAEARHAETQKICWQRFLVSSCLDAAAKALRDEKTRAHAKEKAAREIEIGIRKREIAEKDAKRQAEQAGNAQSTQPRK